MMSQPTCRYKKLWDQDKDAYIRRYEKANKPLSSYELDIKEYLNKEVCASVPAMSIAEWKAGFCLLQVHLLPSAGAKQRACTLDTPVYACYHNAGCVLSAACRMRSSVRRPRQMSSSCLWTVAP
jgi:hypothetical protein